MIINTEPKLGKFKFKGPQQHLRGGTADAAAAAAIAIAINVQ